jgi:hypothetical protein
METAATSRRPADDSVKNEGVAPRWLAVKNEGVAPRWLAPRGGSR